MDPSGPGARTLSSRWSMTRTSPTARSSTVRPAALVSSYFTPLLLRFQNAATLLSSKMAPEGNGQLASTVIGHQSCSVLSRTSVVHAVAVLGPEFAPSEPQLLA